MVKSVNNQAGFSTMEILIASSILVTVFTAVILLVLGSQKLSTDTQTAHEAQLLNQKMMEEARAVSLSNFNYDLKIDPPVSEGIYSKSRTQRYLSECVKEITTRVDWNIEGRSQYVTGTTFVTNPSFAMQSGTECNVPNSSQYAQCYLYGSANLEVPGESSPDQDAYDLDVTRINGRKYVFIVTHPSNSHQRPEDFWVYDISDNANPQLVNHLDINNEPDIGINSVTIAQANNGSYYAYLANDDSSNHLIVVNVSIPSSIPAPNIVNINGVGNNKVNDIDFLNNKLYVAISNDIRVYNASNPSALVPSFALSLGGTVNKMALNSNYLYAATSDNQGELSRINLSTNAIIKYNLNGNSNNKSGTSIKVLGNRIYLGIISGQNEDNFYIIEDQGTSFTTIVSKNLPHQNNKKIYDHIILGNFLFVLVQESNKEFQVYDISDLNNFVDKCTSTNPTNIGYGLDLFENFVYLSMRANSELQIYSDQQP